MQLADVIIHNVMIPIILVEFNFAWSLKYSTILRLKTCILVLDYIAVAIALLSSLSTRLAAGSIVYH